MPRQVYSEITVVDATKTRLGLLFDNFETIIVSVSGGKDSTVLAHLALEEAHKRGRKIGLYFLDEEAVYQSTIDQIRRLMTMFPDNVNKLWLQVEFNLTNATSVTETQLRCWEHGKHKDWMRSKEKDSIHFRTWAETDQTVRDKVKGLGFYDVIDNFEATYSNAAFLVGLRAAGESPNRWRAVTRNPVQVGGRDVYWGTRKGRNIAFYPIYDWNYHDVWRYIYDSALPYSKIYDMQFRKGYQLAQLRTSSLIHERSFKAICDLPEFEPKTYDKLCKRVKGVQLVQEKGRDAKLFAVRKLPKNYTSWIAYRDFLLQTHQDQQHIGIFQRRFSRHLTNEYVARQQCRQLILNDYENNLTIDNSPDPREALIAYYGEVL